MIKITFQQLRAFRSVADLGSFTEASHLINLTQSALSILVRELERELKVKLFDRNTRRVTLTEAGRDFYPNADRILQELETSVSRVSSLRDRRRGTLRIAAGQMISFSLVPEVIAAYVKEYPEVEVKLIDTGAEQLFDRVLGGDVELAIGPDIRTLRPGIQRHELAAFPMALVCRADHPFVNKPKVSWAKLETEAFISPTRDFARHLLSELDGTTIKPVYEVSYISTALGMVLEGLGVTATPSYSSWLVKALGLVMIPLVDPVHERHLCFYNLSQRSLSAAAESFIETLVKTAQKRRIVIRRKSPSSV